MSSIAIFTVWVGSPALALAILPLLWCQSATERGPLTFVRYVTVGTESLWKRSPQSSWPNWRRKPRNSPPIRTYKVVTWSLRAGVPGDICAGPLPVGSEVLLPACLVFFRGAPLSVLSLKRQARVLGPHRGDRRRRPLATCSGWAESTSAGPRSIWPSLLIGRNPRHPPSKFALVTNRFKRRSRPLCRILALPKRRKIMCRVTEGRTNANVNLASAARTQTASSFTAKAGIRSRVKRITGIEGEAEDMGTTAHCRKRRPMVRQS